MEELRKMVHGLRSQIESQQKLIAGLKYEKAQAIKEKERAEIQMQAVDKKWKDLEKLFGKVKQ